MSLAEVMTGTPDVVVPVPAARPGKPASAQVSAPRANEADLPATAMTVELVRDARRLHEWTGRWSRLTEMAADANVFYEPGFLLPALEHLRGGDDVGVMLVHAPPRVNASAAPVLCGLFPVRLLKRFNGLPVRVMELWRHEQCFLTTPLVRRDAVPEVWGAVQKWLRETSLFGRKRCDWLHLPMTAGSGPVHDRVVDWLESSGAKSLLRRRYRRAVLQTPASLEQFLAVHVPRKLRQESGRLRRKLEQSGPVSVRVSTGAGAINSLLGLEQSGWKGRAGTALASDPATERFIRAAAGKLAASGQLQVLELLAGERVIAAKLNLLSGRQAFGFKIAYDEAFASLSPGLLLEIENIGQLAQAGQVDGMDSCADPDHPMIDHLWPERRTVESLLLSCGTRRGDWLLAARPLIQQLSARLSGTRKPTTRCEAQPRNGTDARLRPR